MSRVNRFLVPAVAVMLADRALGGLDELAGEFVRDYIHLDYLLGPCVVV